MAKLKKLVYSIASLAIVLGSFLTFSATSVAAATPAYDYQLISQSAYPATLAPGATTNVYIEVKNTGTAVWGNSVRLGTGSSYGAANQQRDYASEFANSDWLSNNRPCGMSNGTPVSDIQPGWVVRFQFNIKAPTTAGTYKAYFTPVVDGVTWMKDIGIYWQITVSGTTPVTPVTPVIVNPTTPSTVGLSSDTPASANIPRGARGVTFSKFVINGGSSDATINTLTVQRVGAGASSDFDSVYLYDGNNRLTTGKSINTSTNEVVFGALNLALPANSQKVLSVVADIAAGAGQGNSNAFEISAASKILGVSLSGSFPIVGSYMTNAAATVGEVTVTTSGSITGPKIGDQNVEIAEFNVRATGTEDITVRRIALTNLGSVTSTNLTGLTLKLNNGTPEATSTGFVNDVATFVLDTPLVITNGSSKIFQLFADVTGRVGDIIKIDLDNDADIYATGNTYGYGVSVVRTGYDNSLGNGNDASWSTLQGGTITITSSGPAVQDIGVNMTDQPLLNLAVASGANAEVRNTRIELTSTNGDMGNGTNTNWLTNIKISDSNGNIVAGPMEMSYLDAGNDDAILVFTDRYDLTAGTTTNLVVSANIANDPTDLAGVAVTATLLPFQDTDIKSLDTNDYITDIVPSSSNLVGKAQTIQASAVSLSLAATPGSQSVVTNKQGVDTVGFLVSAGSASAVTVTGIKLTGYFDNNTGTFVAGSGLLRNIVSSISLYNATTGATVGAAKSLASDGTVNFTGLNIQIPESGTVKLDPIVNIDSPTIVGTERFSFDIALVGDITAQDSNSSSVSPLTAHPNGTTSPTVKDTLATTGTLTAAVSAATPVTAIAQAGASAVQFTKAKFYATGEAFTVQTLLVKDPGATYDRDLNGITLTYKDINGATQSVTGYISNGKLTFTGLGIYVPKDGNTEVTIAANMNTITSSGGSVSGDQPQLDIDEGDGGTSGNFDGTAFKAIGVDSSTPIYQLAGDVLGQPMVVRKTTPVITTNAVVGTLAGQIILNSINIAAGSGSDASFQQLSFDLSSTLNVTTADGLGTITNILVYKDGIQVPAGDIAITTTSGTTIASSDTSMIISWKTGKELVVGQGTSSNIVIKGTTNVATSSTFTCSLAGENDTAVETGVVAIAAGTVLKVHNVAADIIWSDNSSTTHSATYGSSSDFSNSYPLNTLPGASFSYTHGQ